MTGRPHSTRHEPCGTCGDPLFVCPSTLRRLVRCCEACTHRTEVDDEYEEMFPDWIDQPNESEAA